MPALSRRRRCPSRCAHCAAGGKSPQTPTESLCHSCINKFSNFDQMWTQNPKNAMLQCLLFLCSHKSSDYLRKFQFVQEKIEELPKQGWETIKEGFRRRSSKCTCSLQQMLNSLLGVSCLWVSLGLSPEPPVASPGGGLDVRLSKHKDLDEDRQHEQDIEHGHHHGGRGHLHQLCVAHGTLSLD